MKYHTILADPPWPYRDKNTRACPEGKHYPTMSLAEIIGLGKMVARHADSEAHLWMWATNSLLLEGWPQRICYLWGFAPKQLITWIKPRIGMGHWCRNQTEHLILAVRGRLAPLARNQPTFFFGDAPPVHSRKPLASYQFIESISPGPRLELFARVAREGWQSWGNQAPEETRIEEGE